MAVVFLSELHGARRFGLHLDCHDVVAVVPVDRNVVIELDSLAGACNQAAAAFTFLVNGILGTIPLRELPVVCFLLSAYNYAPVNRHEAWLQLLAIRFNPMLVLHRALAVGVFEGRLRLPVVRVSNVENDLVVRQH